MKILNHIQKLFAALFVVLSQLCSLGASVPAGFSETIMPGPVSGNWTEAVGITFDNLGRIFVWERVGKVWFKDPSDAGFSQLLDISQEVGDWQDHGLLGFALDPNFRSNGYIYLLYVVDRHHLMNFGLPSYNPTANEYNAATIGRVTRFTCRTSDNFRSIDPASRTVLLGETKQSGIPLMSYTHGIGSLVFGQDGTLFVSSGDGASADLADIGGNISGSYAPQALADGILRSKEDVGAYRSQIVDSLDGKILRIDPATGNGIPSNPFFDPSNPRAPKSRVWALGLRNPFRFSLRPGSGSHNPSEGKPGVLYVGDVGWSNWEALRVISGPAQNAGWPIYEGFDLSEFSTYGIQNKDAPNPLYPASGCNQFFRFIDLIGADTLNASSFPPFVNPCNNSQRIPATIPQFLHTRPVLDWSHSTAQTRTPIYTTGGQASTVNVGAAGSPVSGSQFMGNCAVGGTWYTGNVFPSQYQNSYFFADWGQMAIKLATFDANNKPLSVNNFAGSAGAVVCIAQHPLDGSLYYVSYTFGDSGTVRKLAYTGNRNPIVAASVNSNFGSSPLTVQFSSSGSSDPDGQALTYNWNFGDGTPASTLPNPSHTFSAPGGVPTPFNVILTVSDPLGLTAEARVVIAVNDTPPDVQITSPADGSLYPLGTSTTLDLTATVADGETADPQLTYNWQTLLHHNEHNHVVSVSSSHAASTVLDPVGCDGINVYYYRILLTVTDPQGLSTTKEVAVFPNCGPNTAPTISDLQDQTINEDTPTTSIAFTVNDAETPAANLTVSAVSSNPTLVPAENVIFGGSGANRTLAVSPQTNQTGTATISITVSDGLTTRADTFLINVTPINDAPFATPISNQSTRVGIAVGPISFTISDVDSALGSLAITAHSTNPTLVPDANLTLGGIGANRTITITPLAGQTGTATITITVTDTLLGSTSSFLLSVNNQVAGLVAAYGFNEGAGFTANDSSGNNLNGTINGASWTPSGKYGNALRFDGSTSFVDLGNPTAFRITGSMTWSAWINAAANPVDDGQIIAKSDGQSGWQFKTSPDTGPHTFGVGLSGSGGFTQRYSSTARSLNSWSHVAGVYDAGLGRLDLYVNGVLNNGTLLGAIPTVPIDNLAINANIGRRTGGFYFDGIIDEVRIYNRALSAAEIQTDMNSPVGSSPAPAAPTIEDITDRSTSIGTATPAIPFTVADTDTPVSSLTLAAVSSNPALVPNGSILFGGSGANRTVTVAPVAGLTGIATITVTVSDGSLTASDAFVLSVNAVNTTPSISDILDQTINEDASTGSLIFSIADAETAAASLTVSAASSNPSLIPLGNIVLSGTGANRTLTLAPAMNQSGNSTITLTVSDGSLTASDSFLVSVNSINDAPTISSIADQSTAVGVPTAPISFTVGDVDGPVAGLTVFGASSNPALIPNANITIGGSSANRTVTISPAAGQSGNATITITVNDGSLSSSTSFGILVNNQLAGLIAAYSFNEGAGLVVNDSSGNNLNGVLNGATWTQAGKYGNALSFDGSTSFVDLGNPAPLQITGGMTWSAWIKAAANPEDDGQIIAKSDGSTGWQFKTSPDTGPHTFGVGVSRTSGFTQRYSSTTRTLNVWYHVAGVYDAALGRLDLYVNGVLNNGTLLGGVPASQVNNAIVNANIGRRTGGFYFNGIIDEVRIYNRALSAAEIQSDMSTPIGSSTPPVAAPTISDISNQVTAPGTATSAIPFTIADLDTQVSALTLSGASSNPTLVPNGNILFGGSGGNRTVTVLPAAGLSGTATITITVSDGTLVASDSFVLTVGALNTAPSISDILDQTINEDASTGLLNFSVADAETAATSLIVTASSSNPALIPTGNLVLSGSGANRTLSATPAVNLSGSATITLTVNDGTLTASDSFFLTVNAVNDAPTISDITNQTINEDSATTPLSFTIGDVETAATSLTVTTASSNPTLVPAANIAVSGSGANRAVTVTPAPNAFGSSTITLTVSDGTLTASDSFLVTVNSVNDAPTISDIINQTINEDSATAALSFTISDFETAVGSLTVTSSSSNPNVVPLANVVVAGLGASRTVTLTPAPNQSGNSTITLTVSDGVLSSSDTFVVSVTGVNDRPTISDVTNQTINEDTPTAALSFTVGDIESVPASLTVTRASSSTTLVPTGNIVISGTGANRAVTVTPAANRSGTATITLTVSDGALTASDTFLLTVNPVNDVPTISNIADQTTTTGVATGAIGFTIGDVETAPNSLTLSRSSSNPTLVPLASIVFGGSGANRTVRVTPAPGQAGNATITVAVSDGSLTASDTFVLTVNSGNTAPAISDVFNQTINEDTTIGPLNFTIGDAETAAVNLMVTRTSSNPALIPVANVVLGGSGTGRTATITPAANQVGTSTISLTVSDGAMTASDSFDVTVNAVNDAPTISNIADQGTAPGVATPPISFTLGDVDNPVTSLTLAGNSSNPTLVPLSNIVFGGSGANRTVTVTPAPGQVGASTITVTVGDGSLTANDSYVLTVTAAGSGLVAGYGFNEGFGSTTADISPNNNIGTIAGASWTTAGKFGSALSFDISGSTVTINNSPSLTLTAAMTLEAWVYPTEIGWWQDVIYKGVNDIYFLMGSSNDNTPAMGGTFASVEVKGLAPLALNTWTHLAGTYDGAALRLYINGVQVATRTQSGNIATSTGPLTIGGDALYGQYFSGRIDEVRIYNRALAAAEIQTDMNTPVGSFSLASAGMGQVVPISIFIDPLNGGTFVFRVNSPPGIPCEIQVSEDLQHWQMFRRYVGTDVETVFTVDVESSRFYRAVQAQ